MNNLFKLFSLSLAAILTGCASTPVPIHIIHKEGGLYANLSSTDYEKKLVGEVNDYQDILWR